MAMHVGAGQRQHQNAGMVPDHFLGKNILKMGMQDLQQFVQEQLAENPALVMSDDAAMCPVCGGALMGGFCPTCGSETLTVEADVTDNSDDWDEEMYTAPADDEICEAINFVAAPSSLTEYLMEQISTVADGETRRIAEFLIASLDEDGYIREPLIEIASEFQMSVPQIEEVLRVVQSLEPAGVGARDLRECLSLQIAQIDDDSDDKQLAEIILREHWEAVERMRLDNLAGALGVEAENITDALAFIKENLTPHPADSFRDAWEKLAPKREARCVPDVLVRSTDTGLNAEILDPVTGQAALDEAYSSLYAEMQKRLGGFTEEERTHIRECVQGARVLIESLEFRKSTLRRVVDAIVAEQTGFIVNGSSYLRPLTRKHLADKLGVHESTVCRATTDKNMQLPTGEVIPFDIFFDSALPVKELVRKLASERPNGKAMSDNEIAKRLKDMGFEIARRTVAKYRAQLRVLSQDYRLAA